MSVNEPERQTDERERQTDERERENAQPAGAGFEERVRWLLAVPHVAVFSSVVDDNGTWVRRAEYPEIPGCVVEAPSAVEAADRLEELRVRLIVAGCRSGTEPLVGRDALPGGTAGLSGLTVEEALRRGL